MLKITGILMRNFLSVGAIPQMVVLDKHTMTLVLGQNLDAGAANSRNGVGKTTILQAICYGLFGTPLTRIKLDNLCNNINAKGMRVEVAWEKDGKKYRVERGRKPNLLRFFVDDSERVGEESDETAGENRQTQVEIERAIGMSPTMFRHIVALNTFTEPFLRMKAADQREVIEELLGVALLTQRAETLKAHVARTKETVRVEEASIKSKVEANGRIEAAIRRAEEEAGAWEAVREKRLATLFAEFERLAGIDFDGELAVFDALDRWVEEEKALRAALTEKASEAKLLERELAKTEAEATGKEREAASLTDAQIGRLQAEARRYRADAEGGTDPQIARLEAEAQRCETEAKKTIDAQLARMAAEAERKDQSALRKVGDPAARQAEVEAALRAAENADGHSCATCGQDLKEGSHLETVLANLAAQATSLAEALERDLTEAATLQQEADAIRAEIEQAKTDHAARVADWQAKATAAREQAAGLEQTLVDRRVEWLTKAVEIETEIEAARTALATKKEALLATASQLREEAATIGTGLAENAAATAEIEDAISALGARPKTTYASRDDVWRAKQERDGLVRDIETEAEKENPHAGRVTSLRDTLSEVSYDALNEANVLLRHQEFLLKLLTSKDSFIRKRIVDTNLNYLNGRLNHYLEAIGLPHEVRFQPDLTVEISLLGKDFDFEQLSRGEQNRLILATSWAFRDVWESLNVSINLMMADEVLDSGIDEAGGEAALDVMNKMARERGRNVFLVSHKEGLIGRASRILLVRKEDGFTRFEEEDAEVPAAA